MRLSDELYFAPDIKFSQLDLTGEKLPAQLKERIDFFFIQPTDVLLRGNYLFTTGIILVSCIDFLASIPDISKPVGERFKKWCHEELPGMNSAICELFYNDFRNGLVHEARIKNGGEFSLDSGSTLFDIYGESLRVNPKLLHAEVEKVFNNYILKLKKNKEPRELLVNWTKDMFRFELNNEKRED